jgi:23S rRNA pseudouridine2605 synthase
MTHKAHHQKPEDSAAKGERIAKVMARAGLCSRRDAERWIEAGRVVLNGRKLTSPATNVADNDVIEVDGKPLPQKERTRLWLYHKPRGLIVSTRDGRGRKPFYETLPEGLPRVQPVGRLDVNTEGLLLLTNDGGLKRVLELPSTGWLRQYRVRVHGRVTQAQLDSLRKGIEIEGVHYGEVIAQLDREKGANAWLLVGLREGKNREIKVIMNHLGLAVTRLIRVSYGPFQLGELEEGGVQEIRSRTLRDQLGPRLMQDSGADFEAPLLTAPLQSQKRERVARPMTAKISKPSTSKRKPGQMPGKFDKEARDPRRKQSSRPKGGNVKPARTRDKKG